MKIATRLLRAIFLFCAPLLAQLPTDSPVDVIRHPVWVKGVFLGGSTSFANTPSAQTLLAGVRFGRVLTNEHGSNFLRGSFEMDVDVIPINEFWYNGNAQYAAAINPFIAKWNFTNNCKLAPWRRRWRHRLQHQQPAAGRHLGGELHQRSRAGLAYLSCRPQGPRFGGKGLSPFQRFIGNQNPGINGAVQFTVGYSWF